MSTSILRDSQTARKDLPLPTPPRDSPPPTYTVNDSNGPTLPDITAAFSNLNLATSPSPTPDQCLAHLKLLECFHQLRESTACNDGLFGIRDDFVPDKVTDQQRGELLTKIREKRWGVYVTRAAKRFERWWKQCVEPQAQMLTQKSLQATFDPKADQGPILAFDRYTLPPLDVIMVWHAYQLNPRDFFEDCLRYGKLSFWRTGLPWAAINSCIDNTSFEFTATKEAMLSFESLTNYPWNNIDQPLLTVECPECSELHSVPETGWNSASAWVAWSGTQTMLAGEISAYGFADKNFSFRGPCGAVMNHELLKIKKFRHDVEALRRKDIPLPGTILNLDGIPESPSVIHKHAPFFPNRLILGPGGNTSALYEALVPATTTSSSRICTMNDIRSQIELALKDKSYIKKVKATYTSVIYREERIAIRRMMSHYWENSSPFALDLVGAVIRQGSFIEKMHSIDWIHSPAATSTMKRLLIKYGRYFQILAACPTQVAVPTLDVDLAWHTHQLSPPNYYQQSLKMTSKFIDHDDKIEETKLSSAFEWTSKTYQKRFDELYSECTCWYCEAIRESHTSGLKRVFGGNTQIDKQLSRLHSASDPRSTPHISAHNAIKAETDIDRRIREATMQRKLERNYQKAVQRARKNGRDPPARDNYMYAYAWGYPMYMPYYAPYMGDPCVTGGMYASNPACANMTTGGFGNCCQGACGGGVAAGACAGNGAGACAGGAVGGCGGGGGGGCGGGGGGGGGGCGGGGGGGGCGGGG